MHRGVVDFDREGSSIDRTQPTKKKRFGHFSSIRELNNNPYIKNCFQISKRASAVSDARDHKLENEIAELRAAVHRHEELFTHAPMGIFRLSPDTGEMELNRTLARLLGYPSQDEANANMNAHRDLYLTQMLPLRDRVMAAGRVESLPFEFILKDRIGRDVLLGGRARGVWNEQGALLLVEGYVWDQTWKSRLLPPGAVPPETDLAIAEVPTPLELDLTVESLMNLLPDPLVLVDAGGRILHVNARAAALFGIESARQLVGQMLADQFMDAQSVSGWETMRRVLHSRSATLFHLRGTGERTLLAEFRLEPLPKAEGAPSHYLALLHPVDEDEEEDALHRERERFFARILETTPDVVFIFDVTEGRYVYFSRQSTTVFGYSSDDREIMDVDQPHRIVHPEDRERVVHARTRDLDSWREGEVRELKYRIRHASGEWKWVSDRSVLFSRTADGGPRQILGLLADITDHVAVQDALGTSERKFRTVFTQSPIGMTLLEPATFQILEANRSFCTMLDFEEKEILQYTLGNLTLPEDLPIILDTRHRLLEAGETDFLIEPRLVQRDGRVLLTRIRPIHISSAAGSDPLVLAVVEDITERRRNSEQLRESARALEELNANKDQFFSIISHDLRSPFSTLIGYADFLVQEFDSFDKEEMRPILTSMHRSARTIFDLLENLLFWARLQQGKMSYQPIQVNLAEFVQKIVNTLRGTAIRKDIGLQVLIAPDLHVMADINMLQSIFLNLIGNALKFTPTHGQVRVEAFRHKGEIYVRVVDTGVGMKAEDVERLFTIGSTFSRSGTAGETGTGLGLILCQEMIRKNHGSISVQSQPGKGSIFEFSLPATDG